MDIHLVYSVLCRHVFRSTQAQLATCCRELRDESRRQRRNRLRQLIDAVGKAKKMPDSDWIRYCLWHPTRPFVSQLSTRLLIQTLSMDREQLIELFCSQSEFHLYLGAESTPISPSNEMRRWIAYFGKVMTSHQLDRWERRGEITRGKLRKAFLELPMFMLRLLVARDCHLGSLPDDRYSSIPLQVTVPPF